MDLGNAYELILRLLENDWETIILICGSLFALKGVKVLNGGLYAQVANWLASALASGLFANQNLSTGLRAVAFASFSALAYHLVSKLILPQAKTLVAQLQAKK